LEMCCNMKHPTFQALVLVAVFCVFFSPLHKSNIEFTRMCNKGVECEYAFKHRTKFHFNKVSIHFYNKESHAQILMPLFIKSSEAKL
jgi:hypothetical protein